VALARAVVLEPEVLLLDEPMAALDLKLRKEMQVEVKNLQERLRITFLFVTHDQDEALIMSDRIAVMNEGRIEQLGAPEELYERPRTRFVADFLGVKNILTATVEDVNGERVSLATPAGPLVAANDGGYARGATVTIGIRPERLTLASAEGPGRREEPADGGGGANRMAGRLEDEIYLGDFTDWLVRVGDVLFTVSEGAARAQKRRRGEAAFVSFPPDAVLRLEDAPERA
jgi:spermidine/putrescine transport system ATP-binding protein